MENISRIYLDNAATTRLSAEVLKEMRPYLEGQFGNPNSLHSEGRVARLAVETSRRSIAGDLSCKPSELFFTSCGTESNNMAIRCAVRDLRITHIVTSRIEHDAVLNTVRNLQLKGQISLISYVRLDENGSVDIHDLERLLKDNHQPTLVTFMHANNETGTMTDLMAISILCRRYKAVFHSDCVQTVGHLPFDLASTPVDMISASAHKFHGPKGSGLLYVREGVKIQSLMTGGGQERGMRPGTENVAGIVGFATALGIAQQEYKTEMPRIIELKWELMQKLQSMGCSFNGGNPATGLYTILNVGFAKTEETANLLLDLDETGIAVSGGSACSAGKGSHVMNELKANDKVNIRFSFSKYNCKAEIRQVLSFLEKKIPVAVE